MIRTQTILRSTNVITSISQYVFMVTVIPDTWAVPSTIIFATADFVIHVQQFMHTKHATCMWTIIATVHGTNSIKLVHFVPHTNEHP